MNNYRAVFEEMRSREAEAAKGFEVAGLLKDLGIDVDNEPGDDIY